ncbi:hypothetical protein GCM10010406_21930 [Streptomyces thermolineatus]|uniref:Uncharacterized protein n=1 Tax=Streptomyces thermolineatus TaxID=44033 RepID=A0ABP5YT35_9ACTN
MHEPFVIRLRRIACRVRAGEVARPLTRLHPKEPSLTGGPAVPGPPFLPIRGVSICRPVRRQDSASARTAPPW